jgi:hypothetical protein
MPPTGSYVTERRIPGGGERRGGALGAAAANRLDVAELDLLGLPEP